ncbi:MAG: ATP synthase subunit I [Planctomycetes bacterium]|nr:ATP synthase subunit I [Planctomycetota bacterium]
MSEGLPLILAGVAGLLLGLFYFGGLWLTIRWLPATRCPALLTLGSLVGRMAVTLAGFYAIMAGRWERLLACLAGFVLMRFVVLACLRPEDAPPLPPQQGQE